MESGTCSEMLQKYGATYVRFGNYGVIVARGGIGIVANIAQNVGTDFTSCYLKEYSSIPSMEESINKDLGYPMGSQWYPVKM